MATEHKIEYKRVKFKVKAFDEAQGTVEGYASTFDNEDLVGDVIVKGAFKKTIKENKDVKMYYNHDIYFSPPIGKWTELQEDEKGLFAKGKISQTAQGKDVFTLLRDDVLNRLSIGYEVIKEDIDREKNIRYLKEIRLREISVVDYPANPEAVITSVKNREEYEKQRKDLDETKQQVTELKQQVKSLEEQISGLFSMIGQNSKQSLPDAGEPESSTPQVDGADIAKPSDSEDIGLCLNLEEMRNRLKRLSSKL